MNLRFTICDSRQNNFFFYNFKTKQFYFIIFHDIDPSYATSIVASHMVSKNQHQQWPKKWCLIYLGSWTHFIVCFQATVPTCQTTFNGVLNPIHPNISACNQGRPPKTHFLPFHKAIQTAFNVANFLPWYITRPFNHNHPCVSTCIQWAHKKCILKKTCIRSPSYVHRDDIWARDSHI